jgi:hypothetical membrane protein
MGENNSVLKPYYKIAGVLFFLAGAISLMGIITAETLYPPGYSTSANEISDLGSTRPPNSVIHQPSAVIFNTTMIVTGLMILSGVYFVQKAYKKPFASIPVGLLGLGVLGVGIFPGNVDPWHGLFSLLTFFSGGIAAITSSKIVIPPFSRLGIIFGAITLFSLFSANPFIPILGIGGVERWVAYPIILWLIGFGGYLLGTQSAIKESMERGE